MQVLSAQDESPAAKAGLHVGDSILQVNGKVPMTPQLAQQFAFGTMEGLLVGEVDRGSPAAAAEIDGGMLLTSIDGQVTTSIVAAAKILSPRKKDDKAKLNVVFPRQRGPFIEFRQATVELTLQ